jgi:hypothetical protein
MADLKSDKIQLTLAPEEQAIIVRGGMTVRFAENGSVTVQQDGVTVYPPANENAPPAQPALANEHGKTPDKPAWLTREFLEAAQQGQKLPDGSVHIQLDDGTHWAVAADVATPREYGWGSDLGAVGKWMAEKNESNAHGHKNWQMPNSPIGRKLYDLREEGELKAMFSSVRGLWLAELYDLFARVQWFDVGSQFDYYRNYSHSVCAVRRLEI